MNVENQPNINYQRPPSQISNNNNLEYGQDSCVTDFGKSYGNNSLQVKSIKYNENEEMQKNINDTNSRFTNDKKIRANRGNVGISRNTDNTLILNSNANNDRNVNGVQKINNNFINEANFS